jgi:hypothetical protein
MTRKKAINLKLLLYAFDLMSGLKINFMKSEVFIVSGDNDITTLYANMLNCRVGKLPMRYLGVPVTFINLKIVDWAFVDAKVLKNWLLGFVMVQLQVEG